MAKFYDVVGYGHSALQAAGVFADEITERRYFGDVIRDTRRLQATSQEVNSELKPDNSISIVSDSYANENIFAIRYVKWAGHLWTVDSVQIERPRLILRLGGVYNGPVATP